MDSKRPLIKKKLLHLNYFQMLKHIFWFSYEVQLRRAVAANVSDISVQRFFLPPTFVCRVGYFYSLAPIQSEQEEGYEISTYILCSCYD